MENKIQIQIRKSSFPRQSGDSSLIPKKYSKFFRGDNEDISQNQATTEEENIVNFLRKKPRDRSQKEVTTFSTYLGRIRFSEKLPKEQVEEYNIHTVFYLCSLYMEDKYFEAGQTIFNEGDIGDKFYVILKGKVALYKLTENVENFTIKEYHKFIKEFKKKADVDQFILSKTLDANNSNFNINFPLDLIDDAYLNVFPTHKKIECKYYTYKKINTLSSGASFGDYALDSKDIKKRSATAKTEDECVLLVFDKQMYMEHILNENLKSRAREVTFLQELFFFTPIRKNRFDKKYFNEFALLNLTCGTMLVKENELPTEIFFIKEGVIELVINKINLLEIQKIISTLCNLDPLAKELYNQESEVHLENQLKNFIAELKLKRKILLFKTVNKEIIGEMEFFFGLKNIFTAQVISKRAKVYKLEFAKLQQIYSEENGLYTSLKDFAIRKVQSLLERLTEIQNTFLTRIDKEYSTTCRMMQTKNSILSRKNATVKLNHHFNPGHSTFFNSYQTKIPIKPGYIAQDSVEYESFDTSQSHRKCASDIPYKYPTSPKIENSHSIEEAQLRKLKKKIKSNESEYYQLSFQNRNENIMGVSVVDMLPKITCGVNKSKSKSKSKSKNENENEDSNVQQRPGNNKHKKMNSILPFVNKMKLSCARNKKRKQMYYDFSQKRVFFRNLLGCEVKKNVSFSQSSISTKK